MGRITQQDIATRVGLSRTTVTKILNRDPKYITSEETRDKVFKVAAELGYNFMQVKRPFRREDCRAQINTVAAITILFEDGGIFDKGSAVVVDVSVSGALLTGIELEKGLLPLKKFSVILGIKEIEVIGECEIVRFAGLASDGAVEVGVRFLGISDQDRCRVQEFVKRSGGR